MGSQAQIITISSGKGGVGKTSIAVNLGLKLSHAGYKTCVFDADANLANINIMLKLNPEATLEQVLLGEKSLKDITLNYSGLDVIPGGSGLSNLISLTSGHLKKLVNAIRMLKSRYDYLIIDTPAGISRAVLSYIEISHRNIIVITPEPTSLTDAFSLLRVASANTRKSSFDILVNKVADQPQSKEVFQRFSAATRKYIGCDVKFLDYIVDDNRVTDSVYSQTPVTVEYPSSPASRCFTQLTRNILPKTSATRNNIKEFPHVQRHTPVTNRPAREHYPSRTSSTTGTIQNNSLSLDGIKSYLFEVIRNKKVKQDKLETMLEEMLHLFDQHYGNSEQLISRLYNTTYSISSSNHLAQPAVCNHTDHCESPDRKTNIQVVSNKTPGNESAADEKSRAQNRTQSSLLDSIRFASLTD